MIYVDHIVLESPMQNVSEISLDHIESLFKRKYWKLVKIVQHNMYGSKMWKISSDLKD